MQMQMLSMSKHPKQQREGQTGWYEGAGWGFWPSLIIWAATNSGPLTSTPFHVVYTMNEICFHLLRHYPLLIFHDSKLSLSTPTKPKQERVHAEHHPITIVSIRNLGILIETLKQAVGHFPFGLIPSLLRINNELCLSSQQSAILVKKYFIYMKFRK